MEKLKTLLDRVYELEGLIHLALSRNDDASARIASLIAAKGEAVSRALADFEMSAVPSDAELPEGPNPLAEAEDFIAYSIEEDEQIENSDAVEPLTRIEAGSEQSDDSLSEEVTGDAADTTEITENADETIDSRSYGDRKRDEEKRDEEKRDEDKRCEDHEEDMKPHNLRSLFSINDRFRFSRELFGGSTRRFDDSLAYLDGAIDFNEVEDFFLGDQGFDPESEVVKEFLETLSRGFAD